VLRFEELNSDVQNALAMFDQRSYTKLPEAIMRHTADQLWVVSARVDPVREDAWNRWYSRDHIPEVVTCPGFVSGARYFTSAPAGRRYLTIYELSSAAAVRSPEFSALRGWGPFSSNVESESLLFQRIKL
jgi:hypothetical protein